MRTIPGVRLQPNGRYYAYIRVFRRGMATPVFRGKRFPARTPLRAVLRWRADELREIERRLEQSGQLVAAGTLADDVVTSLELLADRPVLQTQRRQQLAWWVARFGARPRASLTSHDLTRALVELRTAGKAVSTCRHYRTALYRLYTALDGKDAPNPVKDTPTFREDDMPPRGLSYDLVRLILDTLSPVGHGGARAVGSKARARLRVIAWTGMRHSELKRYRPEDWHRAAHTLFVRTGKGGRGRTIPLEAEAEAALTELESVGALGPFSNSTVHRAFRRATKKLDLRDIRPYDLRHSYGTAMYQATGDLRIVAELMGHASLKMTARYTLGAVPTYMRVAVDKFAALTAPGAAQADTAQAEPLLRVIQGGK